MTDGVGAQTLVAIGEAAANHGVDDLSFELPAVVDRESSMHSDAGFSIYDGWQFKGKVIHTMVRGRFAYRDERLCTDAIGHGRYIRRNIPPRLPAGRWRQNARAPLV